eukprot:1185475-Prorocentrum_minimum.AAC.1
MHPEYVVPFEYLYVICKNGCTRHEPQAEGEVSVKCRQTPGGGGAHGELLAVEQLVLEVDDGVGVADGGLHQPTRVLRAPGGQHLQPGHGHVPRGKALPRGREGAERSGRGQKREQGDADTMWLGGKIVRVSKKDALIDVLNVMYDVLYDCTTYYVLYDVLHEAYYTRYSYWPTLTEDQGGGLFNAGCVMRAT